MSGRPMPTPEPASARGCVSDDEVAAFMDGQLDPVAVAALELHLTSCPACRRLLSLVVRASQSVAPAGAEPAPAHDVVLAPGVRVGRFVVLEPVGAGAMGTVYAAHDPLLHRKVALKVLRREELESLGGTSRRDRLRYEAQAMAQLAHPNVVTVHDVLAVGERIVVAMELVDGPTLASWIREAPRNWREILKVLLAAGEGLAAAHAAGLVHRDFKPDNVFIGRDGRVRVGDFGLAHEQSFAPATGEPGATPTRTHGMAGTPYYMAPEQFLGQPTNAAADQFSFCVTAYKAITGEHPFAGDSFETLARAVSEGRLRHARPPKRLPRWLFTVLRRGLAVHPADRYPSMQALLAALAAGPRQARVRRGALACVLVAACGITFAIAHQVSTREPAVVHVRAPPDGRYHFVQAGSRKCLDVDRGGTADGTGVQQWPCGRGPAQAFAVEDQGNGTHRLLDVHSSQCVDVYGSGTADGTIIQLWTCNNTMAQSFVLEARSDGALRLRNRASKKCLRIDGGSSEDGAMVRLWHCDGSDAEWWYPKAEE